MNEVVRDMEKFAHAYLDDLVIFSDTWEEHLVYLEAILGKLREFGLIANMTKCQWAMAECTYLGHVVGGGQVKPEINKLEAVEKFPVPKTKKEVRSFLGLAGYYRRFIKDFASIAVPLTNLTKNKNPDIVVWTEKCDRAFNALKNVLTSTPVLSSPNFEKMFILQTDASNYGVGAVLSQADAEGLDHPIAFLVRSFLTESRNTPQLRKNV